MHPTKPEHARNTAPHLASDNCFICGGEEHADTDHTFWSNAAALAEARENDQRRSIRYPGGHTSPSAAYVAEHRPY